MEYRNENFRNKAKKQKSENKNNDNLKTASDKNNNTNVAHKALLQNACEDSLNHESQNEFSNNKNQNPNQVLITLTENEMPQNIFTDAMESMDAEKLGIPSFKVSENKWHRKTGPPLDWIGPPPPKGCEVFVGKLPRDVFEDELIPILQKAGALFEVRLMMDSSRFNRGFAYIKYTSKLEAERAVSLLNNYEIRPNHFLGVMKSVDNNRLFVGGIPRSRKSEELLEEMKRQTEGVINVILYADVNDRTKNRGFAFVEYSSHAAAYTARQKLLKAPVYLWGSALVKVDWAEPEREVDEETMNLVRILYVRNLSLNTTEQQLRELFCKFGMVERVKKIKDYAFVHFSYRHEAEEAKRQLQGYSLDKCEMDISWSKPVTNREEYHQRKAASRALASGVPSPASALVHTAYGLNGEPIIINQKVRTAAGAQGFITSRPYPLRPPKQNEDRYTAIQPPFIYQPLPYLHDQLAVRSTEHSAVLAPNHPAQYLNSNRISPTEEYVTSSSESHYQIDYSQMYAACAAASCLSCIRTYSKYRQYLAFASLATPRDYAGGSIIYFSKSYVRCIPRNVQCTTILRYSNNVADSNSNGLEYEHRQGVKNKNKFFLIQNMMSNYPLRPA